MGIIFPFWQKNTNFEKTLEKIQICYQNYPMILSTVYDLKIQHIRNFQYFFNIKQNDIPIHKLSHPK